VLVLVPVPGPGWDLAGALLVCADFGGQLLRFGYSRRWFLKLNF
jgi:hypothetical protein